MAMSYLITTETFFSSGDDSCSSSPCLNDATCYDLPDNFVCKCASGHHGDLCNQTTEVPSSVTCAPNTVEVVTSTAVPPSVEATCPVCPNITTEDAQCPNTTQRPDTTPCPVCPELVTPAPCPEITTAAPEAVTSCPTLEPEMDYCSENPCQNSGTCHNGTSGFICRCTGPWGDVDCSQGNKIQF